MSAARLLIGVTFAGFSAMAWSQATPVPATGTGASAASQAATAQGSAEAEKKPADGSSAQDMNAISRQNRNNPSYVPPMNIRMKDEGIALPKCVRESREGEACK